MVKKLLLLVVLASMAWSAFAQSEWESAGPTGLAWIIDSNLNRINSSMNNLVVANLVPETKEDKKNNRWHYYTAKINYQITESRPFEITLNVTNLNNQSGYKYPVYEGTKKKWHTKDLYWGYEIGVNTTSGGTSYFTQNYSDKNGAAGTYSATSQKNSDSGSWTSYYGGKDHSVRVEYDGDRTIKVYDNGTCVKTFYNAKSICYFGFNAGTATKLQVRDFSVKRKSNYGMAKPRIDEAMTKMQKEDWYNAARDFTYVIETLRYTNFDVYFARGFAYAMQEHYKTAIEDFTKALNQYGITSENKESAYYLRGLCRANIGDEECINDMRKAGQDGKIWLRENNLENYVVGSSSNNNQSSGQSSRNSFLPKKFRTGNR